MIDFVFLYVYADKNITVNAFFVKFIYEDEVKYYAALQTYTDVLLLKVGKIVFLQLQLCIISIAGCAFHCKQSLLGRFP